MGSKFIPEKTIHLVDFSETRPKQGQVPTWDDVKGLYVPSNPSSGDGTGGRLLVAEIEVKSVADGGTGALTAISIEGLNALADGGYDIDLVIKNSGSSYSSLFFFVENDVDYNNYRAHKISSTASTVSAGDSAAGMSSAVIFGQVNPSSQALYKIWVSPPLDGKCIVNTYGSYLPTASAVGQMLSSILYTPPVGITNFTKLQLSSNASGSYGIGTKIYVYKRK